MFARNEEQSICDCLSAIERACGNRSYTVAVLVNGSSDRTQQRALSYARSCDRVHVFSIGWPDKSNAWNQFIYKIRPAAQTYFFVDGYVAVSMGSFDALEKALTSGEQVNAATAVPSCGRSAQLIRERMRSFGGLHGSLYGLPRTFVERICEQGVRLPAGLYRGDGLIGAMAMHDLDALSRPWRPALVAVVQDATWTQRPLSLFRARDITRHLRRKVLQARGRLENAAIKSLVYEKGYQALPEFADDMILQWLVRLTPRERQQITRDPLSRIALQRISHATRPLPEIMIAGPAT